MKIPTSAKINSISQIQFNPSKADSLFREADLLAYGDALKSTNKLTARANVKLGKLLFLSNDNTNNQNSEGYFNENCIIIIAKFMAGRGFKISP